MDGLMGLIVIVASAAGGAALARALGLDTGVAAIVGVACAGCAIYVLAKADGRL